ncbi:MAG TPA: sortase [Actinomycetota bacterium]|nr:sortase [Actinomycetota bacterium]
MPWLARPGVRRALAGLAVALVAFGVGMLLYPVTTDIYTSRAQARLRRDFAARVVQEQAPQPAPGPVGLAPPVVAAGQVVALIRIPKLNLDTVMVEGTDPATLREGPGHYPGSSQPCAHGNMAVAGHRTTYGRPFSGLDQLTAGDKITLVTPQRSCTYEVVSGASPRPAPHKGSAAWITSPDDWSAVAPLQGSYLTLTTCHPKGSAAKRLIVRARLVNGPA